MSVYNYLYKVFTYVFNRKIINDRIKERKGKCKFCGRCCNFFGVKCPLLKDNKCMIHKHKPTILCKIGPLNLTEEEIRKNKKDNCGFYWE